MSDGTPDNSEDAARDLGASVVAALLGSVDDLSDTVHDLMGIGAAMVSVVTIVPAAVVAIVPATVAPVTAIVPTAVAPVAPAAVASMVALMPSAVVAVAAMIPAAVIAVVAVVPVATVGVVVAVGCLAIAACVVDLGLGKGRSNCDECCGNESEGSDACLGHFVHQFLHLSSLMSRLSHW